MKELSIAGKATRYDEAINMAKKFYTPDSNNANLKATLGMIFPELKESEDERIRKAIHIYLDWLDGRKDYAPKGEYTIRDMIAWLDRQGKHQKFRDSIQVGDKVTRNEDGVLVNLSQLARVAKPAKNQDVQQETLCGKCRKEQPSHSCQDITALGRCAVEHEQKPAECRQETKPNGGIVSEDFNDGDVYYKVNLAYLSKSQVELIENLVVSWQNSANNIAAWSEEDEEIYRKCICAMRASACGFPEEEKFVEQVDNWLKSLKDRYTWRPSDEQMRALNYVVNLMASSERPTENDLYYNILKSLRQQLKKLMEE